MSTNEHSRLVDSMDSSVRESRRLVTISRRCPTVQNEVFEDSTEPPSQLEPPSGVFLSSMFQSETMNLTELHAVLERATTIVKEHIRMSERTEENRKIVKPLIPTWVTKYLLLITFIWQAINVGILEVLTRVVVTDNSTANHDITIASNVIMTVFESVHLFLAFFVTFKVAKQVSHRTVSGSFLAQSYLSTLLLFAGLYTLEFRFSSSAWSSVPESASNEPVLLSLSMLYFSVSTGTLCGTSEIEPREWYSFLTVSIQMLTSFVYFASILSVGVAPRRRSRFDPNAPKQRSFTRKIRKYIFGEVDDRLMTSS